MRHHAGMDLLASPVPSDHRSGTASTGDESGGPIGPVRLRQRTWWTTVGIVYGIGAFLFVAIVVTERQLPVAVVAALGTVVATVASAHLLERRLPGTAPDTHGRVPVVWLAVVAVGGAVATLGASQWSDTVMGALIPGVASAAVAAQVPARWRSTVLGTAMASTLLVVAGARQVAVGQIDSTAAANQVLLVMAVAGGLIVARWFWQLVHRLERARRLEAALAVADERLRFAADLHDIQGHHLQVIALHSELATRLAASDPDAAATHMSQVHEHARTALADTRSLVQGYRRTPLADELANATRVLEAAGVDGRLEPGTATDAESVGEPGRQLLGLVAREATTNILRHSDAQRARLTLYVDDTRAHLTIRNDGVVAADHPPGTGLTGLAERLEDAGGRLQWHHDDGWFTLDARVPVATHGPT